MTEHDWGRFIGAALVPLFWLLALATALWATRRFFPRAERVLFDPLTTVLRRALRRIRAGRHRE